MTTPATALDDGAKRQDGDAPAFPVTAGNHVYATGMTLRDWFAGQALTAIIEKIPTAAFAKDGTLYQRVGVAAFLYADAMLAARGAA